MRTKTKNPWFVGFSQPQLGKPVLYAFPHAGGGASSVRDLCVALADEYEAYGVRLPGRESRLKEPLVTDMDELAEGLSGELIRHAAGRPVLLYGHCSGSTIAYELAQRLEPGQLQGLAISSHPAPGSLRREPTWALPRQEFLRQVVSDGYLPPEILASEELLDIYEPSVRADYQLIETHELMLFEQGGTGGIQAPLLAVYGLQDDTLEPAQVEAWSALTSGRFGVVALEGGHNLLNHDASGLAAAVLERF